MLHAVGTFEVRLTPQKSEPVARFTLEKTFFSALEGRSASFALQHSRAIKQGETSLHIRVVPGSGTGPLEGLSVQRLLERVDGAHHYTLVYELPEQHSAWADVDGPTNMMLA